jgi:hypothetical protein
MPALRYSYSTEHGLPENVPAAAQRLLGILEKETHNGFSGFHENGHTVNSSCTGVHCAGNLAIPILSVIAKLVIPVSDRFCICFLVQTR